MKIETLKIIGFILLMVGICFLSVLIFTEPAFISQLNLTTKSNIGSAIGGITAPLVGIISATLLYLALTKQIEANKQQQIKNESDVIFSLINQLDLELNNFYHKYNRGLEEKRFGGLEGLNDFSRNYRYHDNIDQFKTQPDFTFKLNYESGQIALIVDSINLIEKRIKLSNLSPEMKSLFKEKLNSFYNCKLSVPLSSLSEAFEMYPHQKDYITDKIQKLVAKHKTVR